MAGTVAGKETKTSPVAAAEVARTSPAIRRALFVVLLGTAALRLWRIDSVIGGFHDYNEANYTLIASRFSPSSLLFPNPDGHLFLETPPFHPYLLALIFRFTGISVVAARLLSVAASLGLVVATFFLGKRLYGERAGLAAAMLVAVAPVSVLTGRNIQTDALFVLLLVAALCARARAESESRRDWLWFGLLLGLATFTKLFAFVAVAALLAWEVAANRDRRAVAKKELWLSLGLAAALPLAYYGYHALRNFAYMRGQVLGGAAAATTLPDSAAEWGGLGLEALWAFSPVVAALMAAGLAAALGSRSRETLFALFPLAGFAVFYAFVHKHSYYLLALLPFGALLAGRWIAGLEARGLRMTLLGLAASTGVFVSLVDLTGMKLGFSEFAELGRVTASLPGDARTLLVSREILKSHRTALLFYDPKARLVTLERLRREQDGRLRLPDAQARFLVTSVPPQTQAVSAGWLLRRERFGLELFGWTFAEAHANPHYFRQGEYQAEHTGGLLDFGLRSLRSYPALALVPVPPGVGLYQTEQGPMLRSIQGQAP